MKDKISIFWFRRDLRLNDNTGLFHSLNENSKVLLGGDLEIDYNNKEGDRSLINQVESFSTVSQMVEFSTMISTTKNKTTLPDPSTITQHKIQNLDHKLDLTTVTSTTRGLSTHPGVNVRHFNKK